MLRAGLAALTVSLLVPLPASAQATAGLVDTSRSPHARLRSVGLGDVRWTDGFWADRLRAVREGSVPTLHRIMNGAEPSQFLHNFRVAAGDVPGRHRGPSWNDGDFFKWLEALAALFALTRDPAYERMLDDAIAVIARAQGADGYLHTPVLIRNRNGDAQARPFGDPQAFEMYNFGHLFTAACVHHRATGKRSLLDVAVRAADFLAAAFETPAPAHARHAICPSHLMGLVELYRTTRDPRHLALAEKLFAMRDLSPGGDDNQDRLPFRAQREAVGHAVRANYLYAGAADLFLENGDRTLLPTLNAVWKNVVSRKLYLTGGCGALYDGASPDGTADQKNISRVHQAYGRSYQLPSSTAHNETCAAVGSVLWNGRMLQIAPDAAHADLVEQTLVNAVLAGVSLDGKRFFYTNTLRQLDEMPTPLRWSRTRQEWISCYCCPPNVVRTLVEAAAYAYGRDDTGVWVHLFGAGTLDTELPGAGRVQLQQQTDYPWSGDVRLMVSSTPGMPWSLHVRIPAWAKGATAAIGDDAPRPVEPGRYAEFRRAWKDGDTLRLHLPMQPRLLEAHPLVEELRNQVAVQRGPLVYCLESNDLPAGARLHDVRLPAGATFSLRFDDDRLPGVGILHGRAVVRPSAVWGDHLYRELGRDEPREIDVRLIPYYAWNNRGPSEMTVWVPLAVRSPGREAKGASDGAGARR